jgi:hypothetical protein
MISSEVQRTLVKSPPELWAELSDPAALARHLGELGDIRITRTEPEKTVEWVAENTNGTVSIQPSGWGTNVKLSVTRELEEPAVAPEAEAAVEPEPDVEPDPALEPTPIASDELPAALEPTPAAALEAAVAPELEHQLRRGFFARLFGRHRRAGTPEIASEPATAEPAAPAAADAVAAVRQVLAPETFAAEHPFAALPCVTPAPQAQTDDQMTKAVPVGDLSAELLAAEEVAAEEVAAVLTAVLDRLGAANHRPFSRA